MSSETIHSGLAAHPTLRCPRKLRISMPTSKSRASRYSKAILTIESWSAIGNGLCRHHLRFLSFPTSSILCGLCQLYYLQDSLEGLRIPALLALRTLKSETVSGLDEQTVMKLTEQFGDSLEWMTTGEHAVIQFLESP